MVSIKPPHGRLVLKRSEADGKSTGAIVLPDTAREKLEWGAVIAVGPSLTLRNGEVKALDVKKGDHVLFNRHAGREGKLDRKEYLILAEKDILAVIDR